jgi:hypothetical protein
MRGLGPGQHERACRDDRVDADHLAKLGTEDHLKEIGVASLGHRRRLLDVM